MSSQNNSKFIKYLIFYWSILIVFLDHYVPASEQQVPEPKIYTGAAIPSRSFKILQAMTTPENAGKKGIQVGGVENYFM